MVSTHNITGADVLVATLEQLGVRTVFSIPGVHNLAVYPALNISPIDNVTMRHEQGAGYAADAFARVSGEPGVCLTTSGPGVLNSVTAAAQAYSDSVPVLFVSSGLPTGRPSYRTGHLHEVHDPLGAMKAVLGDRYCHRVAAVDDIPTVVQQCFALMSESRPRPVYLEIPSDLLESPVNAETRLPVTCPGLRQAHTVQPNFQYIDAASLAISRSHSPIVIAGGGATRASGELVELCEYIGAPVITTTNGKAVVSELHPLSVGSGLHTAAVRRIIAEADLVIAVGTELAESDWWDPLPDLADELIRIDIDPAMIVSNSRPMHPIVGDASAALQALLLRTTPNQQATCSGFARATEWRGLLDQTYRTAPSAYSRISDALNAFAMEFPSSVIAADNSMICYRHLVATLRLQNPSSYLFPTGLGTLGFALPAAIGAKAANPPSVAIAVAGDGAFMFTLAELAAAADARLPIVVLVVDNASYGEIGNEMERRYGIRVAVDFGAVDYRAVAIAMNCAGVSCTPDTDLLAELREAMKRDRPTVIHISASD